MAPASHTIPRIHHPDHAAGIYAGLINPPPTKSKIEDTATAVGAPFMAPASHKIPEYTILIMLPVYMLG
jgi:hypothetical protein